MELRDELEAALGELYSIEQELGGGGMSRVFLAKEKSLGRRVVVKVLPQELDRRGERRPVPARDRARRAAAASAHRDAAVHGPGRGGARTITMPYEEGRSLRAHLREHGLLPIAEVVGLLGDVAKALAFAHERGVIHRDIKPDNILLCGGAAVVSDFGIAKAVSDAKDQPPPRETGETLTQIGMSVGTPTYMAPEQAAADPDVDHRADIYSLRHHGVRDAHRATAVLRQLAAQAARGASHRAAGADPRAAAGYAPHARGHGDGDVSPRSRPIVRRPRRSSCACWRSCMRASSAPRARSCGAAASRGSSRSVSSRSWPCPSSRARRSSRWGCPSGCFPR